MNSSNTGQQLRYLEEVCISLHRAGFETKPPEDCQLPILWNDAPLCRITGKGSGLHGDYHVLADFGSAVLAGHPTERGVQFVTWEWDFDREGVHHGHYFQDDYDAAKRDFTVRGGLVPKDALFEPEQLAEIYRALAFVREQDESLSFGRDQELKELMEQVGGLLPADALRQRDAPEQSGMTMK